MCKTILQLKEDEPRVIILKKIDDILNNSIFEIYAIDKSVGTMRFQLIALKKLVWNGKI